jgi:uncharacterized membrane protein
MKRINGKDLALWIIAVLPLIFTAVFYPLLPDRIPMHWNAAGEIDGWGGPGSAFFIPLLLIGLNVLFIYLPKIDPKKSNYLMFPGAYYAFRLVFTLFMAVLQGVILYSAFHPDGVRVGIIVPAGVGILFAVIGNFMPKFKHNYFVGIKTPWTLANEECWRRTHRLAGPLWLVGGLVTIVSSFLLPGQYNFIVLLVVVVVIAALPILYSALIYKKCG